MSLTIWFPSFSGYDKVFVSIILVSSDDKNHVTECANIVVGEGKRGRGSILATPAREWRLSGSASKNGTSRKSFEEAYSNVEVA